MRNTMVAFTPALVAVALASPALAQDNAASGSLSLSTEGSSAQSTVSSDSPGGEDWMSQYTPEAGLFEFGPFIGLWWINKHHNLHDVNTPQRPIQRPALDIGLRAAFFPLSFLGAEIEGALGPASKSADQAVTLWGLRAHGIAQLPGSRITPFVLLGGGRIGESSDVLGDDGDPALHFGLGAKVALTSLVGLRLDLRDNMHTKNPAKRASDSALVHSPEALLGLTLTLGRSEKKPPPPPPDRDGDGFLDPNDKCPDQPGIAPDGCPDKDPDKDGILDPDDKCPQEKGVAPDGCPDKDPDKDGILDPDDKCPLEKGIAPDGCPDKDPDKDGILDPDDKCPNEAETKNGFEDDDGCPDKLPDAVQKFAGVIQGIEFDVNKATIRAKSFPVLDEAVKVLSDYPKLRIMISGHTDTDGARAQRGTLRATRCFGQRIPGQEEHRRRTHRDSRRWPRRADRRQQHQRRQAEEPPHRVQAATVNVRWG